jgi:hypothetical protein
MPSHGSPYNCGQQFSEKNFGRSQSTRKLDDERSDIDERSSKSNHCVDSDVEEGMVLSARPSANKTRGRLHVKEFGSKRMCSQMTIHDNLVFHRCKRGIHVSRWILCLVIAVCFTPCLDVRGQPLPEQPKT